MSSTTRSSDSSSLGIGAPATGPDNRSKLVLLGSTGSIGTQALEVVAHMAAREAEQLGAAAFEVEGQGEAGFRAGRAPQVVGLAAGGGRLELLAEQAIRFGVPRLALASSRTGLDAELQSLLSLASQRLGLPNRVREILTGPQAVEELIAGAGLGEEHTVLNGVTGSIGLLPTLEALRTGARLALANKESLVVGGALVKQALRRPGQIIPVDSEHSAIAQALASGRHEKGLTSPIVTGRSEVRRLVLTASGGPFRGRKLSELEKVTAKQALAHPTWAMGPVVTVNSSTLINKGLELIEAHLLFDVPPQEIDVVVHPQSVIHSMVEFIDGATIAQASPPDMRLPIALGLTWPQRPDLAGLVTLNDWTQPLAWDFEPLDDETFPAVNLAREAVSASPTHPAVLNAANEQAVAAFLAGRLRWRDIVEIDAAIVAAHEGAQGKLSELSVEEVLAAESWARATAEDEIARREIR